MTAGSHPFAGRPQTLADAVRRARSGGDLGAALSEFLDTFYGHMRHRRLEQAQASINDEPVALDDAVDNAYVAAIAEHLARRWKLSRIPSWTNRPDRFLKRPYFPFAGHNTKALYFVESPIAFRRRLIFTEARPLRRATMALIK